jgi:hypothetical protein
MYLPASGTQATRRTGKYMKLLTILAMLAAPGSGTVFDETAIRVSVPVVLDDSLTTSPLPRG